jgi:transposase-like protein
MPTLRITMRQIRQCLRLHCEAQLSYSQIAQATGVSKTTVGKFILLARAAGLDWALAQTLSDEQIEARLYKQRWPGKLRLADKENACSHGDDSPN